MYPIWFSNILDGVVQEQRKLVLLKSPIDLKMFLRKVSNTDEKLSN